MPQKQDPAALPHGVVTLLHHLGVPTNNMHQCHMYGEQNNWTGVTEGK